MVTSYLSLINRRAGEKLDEQERSFLCFAVFGGKRMLQVVTNLLAYSRVGSIAGAEAAVDLNAVIEEALTNLGVTRAE